MKWEKDETISFGIWFFDENKMKAQTWFSSRKPTWNKNKQSQEGIREMEEDVNFLILLYYRNLQRKGNES